MQGARTRGPAACQEGRYPSPVIAQSLPHGWATFCDPHRPLWSAEVRTPGPFSLRRVPCLRLVPSLLPGSLEVRSLSRPRRERALPSLLRGWVVDEIMILSCVLPLGRQVLEKSQVRFGSSPCSLHIPSQDKFSQPSLGEAVPGMPAFCSARRWRSIFHGCSLWPGMQTSGQDAVPASALPQTSATRPPTPAQCP